jgi:hypothetical protein
MRAATILVEDVPDFEFSGKFVFVTDPDGRRRAMLRSVAIRSFAKFADALRDERISGAEVVQIFPPKPHAASSA